MARLLRASTIPWTSSMPLAATKQGKNWTSLVQSHQNPLPWWSCQTHAHLFDDDDDDDDGDADADADDDDDDGDGDGDGDDDDDDDDGDGDGDGDDDDDDDDDSVGSNVACAAIWSCRFQLETIPK